MNDPLLKVRDLRVDFGANAAVGGANFDLEAGEILGLVGESGSGKTTLARAILKLLPARGSVRFLGQDLLTCSAAALRARRRELQIVFQDPLASLNPRMTVGEAIGEPLRIFEPHLSARARLLRVGAMLERVGLSGDMAERYPHEFSGGQCQRVAIARAMILEPKLLVCDEIVSSLDVSIQGQIVNLLIDLQREAAMAVLFISHNLAVVRHLSQRVMVMYLGKLVEIAPCDALFASPVHPYTRALLAAVVGIPGVPRDPMPPAPPAPLQPSPVTVREPSPVAVLKPSSVMVRERSPVTAPEPSRPARLLTQGCSYRDRCPFALPLCATDAPPLIEVGAGHRAACHRSHETLITLSLPS
jgi:oligopeptide transport system ATP-binding protein